MANFGVQATELSGPSAAGSAPIQAVQPPSQKFDGNWLDIVRPLAKELMMSGSGEDRLTMAVNEYSQKLNNINQAAITGQLSPAAADIKRREVWSTTQTKYGDVPAAQLQQAFHKQFTAAKDASGIDQEMERAKQMRQREDDLVFDGVKLGIYDARFASNPDTRELALDLMQTYHAQERELKQAGQKYEMTRKMVEDGQKDLTWQQQQDKIALEKASKEFFAKNSTKYADVIGALTADLVTKVRSGEVQGEEAIFQLEQQVNSFRAQANAVLVHDTASQTRANQFWDSMLDNAKYHLDPKNIAGFTKERNSLAIEKRKAALMQSDDYFTTLSSIRGMLGDNAFTQLSSLELSISVPKHFAKVGKTGTTTIVQEGDREAQKVIFGSVNKTADALIAGNAPDPKNDAADVERNTKAILGDLSRVRENNPVKLTQTVDFLAGPAVKYLLENKKISAADMMEAGEVYKTLYRQQLMGTVSQVLNSRVEKGPMKGYAGGDVPISNIVDIQVDDNGNVQFIPKWDDKDFNKSTSAQMRAITEVRDINRQMSAINTAIKVGAHMEGRTDYKKYFEENGSLFLPTFIPDKKFIEEQAKNGYKYLGGNRYNPRNWVKTGGNNE